MKERNHFADVGKKVILASIMGLGVATALNAKPSECVGKISWEDWKNKNVAVCMNKEGRVIVEGPTGDPYTLPEEVRRTTQVWSYEGRAYWVETPSEYVVEIGSIDLKTGEVGLPQVYEVQY